MSKEELKPIDVSKYTVTENGNVIKSEEKETTNKELEKRAFAEADKVVIGKGMDKSSVVHLRHLLKNMYVCGAIRETELLSQHILELQADKGNLTDRVTELEAQIEKLQKINNEQKETLKKVRVALIQERTANIMNYGKGGVEMFDDCFEILKGVSN